MCDWIHLTWSLWTVCCTFILQIFSKIIAQPHHTPISSIDACHFFDWVSVKMQYIGIVTAIIVICKSMLMILIVGMMRAEARTIVWTSNCCFIKVKAGCSLATKLGRNLCCYSLHRHVFSVALHVHDWIQLKRSAVTVWSTLVVQFIAASPDQRLKISLTNRWFTGVCPYFRSMSVTVCVIDVEIDAQEHFNK